MVKEIFLRYNGESWEKEKAKITNQLKQEGFVNAYQLNKQYYPHKLIQLAKSGKIEAYRVNFAGTSKWYYKLEDVERNGHEARK